LHGKYYRSLPGVKEQKPLVIDLLRTLQMKLLITLLITFFTGTIAHAQDSLIVWSENRQLKWDDFTGAVKQGTHYDAEVYAEVQYRYMFKDRKHFKFYVFATFNKNTSWSRKERQSEPLLKHEQMHFDLAELYARKLQEEFEKHNYTENFAQEITAIFEPIKKEYLAMQVKCDEETNHSLNKEKQVEWEAFLQNELLKGKFNSSTASRNEADKP
jgi:hypothetical protein